MSLQAKVTSKHALEGEAGPRLQAENSEDCTFSEDCLPGCESGPGTTFFPLSPEQGVMKPLAQLCSTEGFSVQKKPKVT